MSKDSDFEMSRVPRRIGYAVMLGLSISCAVLAVVTALPLPASKQNLLGYISCCSFAPCSTLMLLALAGTSCVMRGRWFKRRSETSHTAH